MIANKRKFVSCLKGKSQKQKPRGKEEITIQKLEAVSFILAFRLAAETKWTPSAAVEAVFLYPKFVKKRVAARRNGNFKRLTMAI